MGKFELKNGARLAAAAGLGLTLALGAAPVVALADGTDDGGAIEAPTDQQDSIATVGDLKSAVASAEDGDTLTLAAGTFDLNGQTLAISKPVNLVGVGAGKTVIKGFVNFTLNQTADESVSSMTVSGITFAAAGDANLGLCWGGNLASGYQLNVQDCAFEGWKYGIGVNSGATGCTLNVSTTTFSGVFCAMSVSNKNNIGDITSADTSGAIYAGQSFNSGGSTSENRPSNGYYETTRDFVDNSDPSENVTVPTSWEAKSSDGRVGSLKDLVENADTEKSVTITLNSDVTLTKGVNVPVGANVTIIGNGHTISFNSAQVGNGVFTNDTVTAPQGIGADTSLRISNVAFTNTGAESSGHAVVLAGNSHDTTVSLEHCSFTNMYTAVYVNPVNQLDDGQAYPSLSITNAKFTKTAYAYSIDTTQDGAVLPPEEPTVTYVATNPPEKGVSETWASPDEQLPVTLISNGIDRRYSSLDAAISAAEDGDTIELAEGEYEGNLVLNKVLTIVGSDEGESIIKFKQDGATKQTYLDTREIYPTVYSNADLTLKNLTIAGPVGENGHAQLDGVYVNGGDLTMEGVTVEDIRCTADGAAICGVQTGIGVVFSGDGDLTIRDCSIEHFQKQGIDVSTSGSVVIDGTTITGYDEQGIIAQNGIVLRDGDAEITDTTITGLQYRADNEWNAGSVAVYLMGDATATLEGCGISNCDWAVGAYDGSKATAHKSTILAPVYSENEDAELDFTGNYWGENPDFDSLIGGEGIEHDPYYADAEMTKLVGENAPMSPSGPSTPAGDAVKVEQSEGGKVSVSPSRADEGDEVTVTVTPEDGQELRGLTVTDSEGNAIEVKSGEKDGEFVFVMPDGDVTVSAVFGCDGGELCPTHGFSDVDQSQWYHDAIDWAVTNKVLNGYGDGGELVGPLATITRAEMAQVLWNQAGRPEATADLSGFADVDASGWYADPVAWCLSEGIFQGYGDTFGTERPISREEVATVLWRLSGSPEADSDLSSFSDASAVSAYATDALAWATDAGVVTGKDDGTKLDPQGPCTRAEVAAMLMRMSE